MFSRVNHMLIAACLLVSAPLAQALELAVVSPRGAAAT